MSALINQARSRVPRIAEAAVERARLTVVPRTVRSRAARVPFVALVSMLLVGGVAGLLAFNTSMQQASFTATAMEQQAAALDARQQSLVMQLDELRDPQRVALRAKDMGMVPPSSPAFIRIGDGKVLGTPTPATYDDSLRVTPLPTRKPKNLRPTPIVIEVRQPKIAAADGGAADPAEATRAGTKKAQHRDPQQGSQR
jgi:type II secretory pathway pseudopilin PulG